MQSVALALITAVFLTACGEDQTRSSSHSDSTPLAVVFTTDFPDVYGPIHVEVESAAEIILDEASSFSCENPALLITSEEIAFSALSEMNFFWSGKRKREAEQTCLEISLDASTLSTGAVYFTKHDPTGRCLPASVSIRIDGRYDELTGIISRSSRLFEPEPPFTPGAEEKLIFQAARDGRAFTVGGGNDSTFYVYEIQSSCGKGEGGGYTPGENGIQGHGS